MDSEDFDNVEIKTEIDSDDDKLDPLSSINLRCLICYYCMDIDEYISNSKSVNGNLNALYKILCCTPKNVNIIPGKIDKKSYLPFCPLCTDLVDKGKDLLAQLEEIKKQLSHKIVQSHEENEDDKNFENNGIMKNVQRVRHDILNSIDFIGEAKYLSLL
jgi:hypothetical protein